MGAELPEVDSADFRAPMSQFASGVTIVTTEDGSGKPFGFTASAFSSLSLNPPLILVCLDRKADCFDLSDENNAQCTVSWMLYSIYNIDFSRIHENAM